MSWFAFDGGLLLWLDDVVRSHVFLDVHYARGGGATKWIIRSVKFAASPMRTCL